MNILAIFAHPDDESYGPGGTLARYALTGHQVSLVTFTRGESGSLGICKTLPNEKVADLRSKELNCAAKALHIKNLKLYEFHDKGLITMREQEGIKLVREEIRFIKADTLITFHPGGISGHPDHIAVTNWCFNAVRQMESAPRLLYYGLPAEQVERIKEHRKMIPFENGEITHIIDISEYFSEKKKAIQCHASQMELWESLNKMDPNYQQFAEREHFSQAYPERKTEQILDDLLA